MIRCAIQRLAAFLLAAATAAAAAPGVATLQEALDSKQDAWGLAAMRQRNGADYEFFADLLPPLRYVNAQFFEYPIVLCAPGSLRKARFVSNGSVINARGGLSTWRDIGLPALFCVGVGDDVESFGEHAKDLVGPGYESGYLPIVQLTYRHGGQLYGEETFAPVTPSLAKHAVLFTRFTLPEGAGGNIWVCFDTNQALHFVDQSVRNKQGQVWAWCDKNWRWDAAQQGLTARVSSRHEASVAIATLPMNEPPSALDYDRQKRECVARWESLLAEAVRLNVPEPIVNNAWKSTIVGSFMLLKGDHMNYGADTSYETMFEAESGDVVRALAAYGLTNQARKMIPPLLDYGEVAGLQFHDAGFKLQLLADYYWLTRDADFVRAQRPRWRPAAEKIMQALKSPSGLLPRELSDGDNNLMIDSLSSNANAWRGLRDIAAVLEDMGEGVEAGPIRVAAAALRKATLAAAEKSTRHETDPPFIPLNLSGPSQPYDVLTATRLGSYWNLMICYVLGSDVFGSGSAAETWILRYLQEHGGLCMGMLRIHQHSGLFANEDGLDDLYTLRYDDALLQRDEPEPALVSFYGKLAQGMTRNTFISAEGTGLRPLDHFGRPMYLPPTCSGDGYFLHLLRSLLVQDFPNDAGEPKTLRLLFPTPRRWLEDGKEIKIEHAPTAFGPVSVDVRSKLSKGEVWADIETPSRNRPEKILLRIRLPQGWKITGAKCGSRNLIVDGTGAVDLSPFQGKISVRFRAGKS